MQRSVPTSIVVGPPPQEPHGQEMVTFASEEARFVNRSLSSSGSYLSASNFDAPVVHGAITQGPDAESSPLLPSNNNQNGLSIFQGYVFLMMM